MLQFAKYLGDLIVGPSLMVHCNMIVLFLSEFDNLGLDAELVSVVDFLLLALLDPVVNGADLGVALLDGHVHPPVRIVRHGSSIFGGFNKLQGKKPSRQI